jgi:quercetin dioxygenase-like cupin family protein
MFLEYFNKVTKEMKLVKLNEKEWLERKGYSKKILLTEDDLKSEGNVVQIVKNEAHTEIKPHYHKRMKEIYHILQGNAVIFCGDTRVRAEPGDTLLCEPGEVHGVVNDTDEDFLFAVFKINAKDDDMVWA